MQKYGIAAWCIDQETGNLDVFHAAKRHGLSAVQLAINSPGDVENLKRSAWRAHINRRSCDADVHISCLALNIVEKIAICGANATDLSRQKFWNIFLSALEFAADVAVPLIYVPSFGLAEITSNACLRETAELIGRAADLACPLQINVASENSLGPVDTKRMIDLVRKENFKILFDVYNPLRWGYSPMEIIDVGYESFAPQIHIKDGWLPGYANAPLGQGDGNVFEVVKELLRRGFDGTFVLENDYAKARGLDLQQDLDALKEIGGQ